MPRREIKAYVTADTKAAAKSLSDLSKSSGVLAGILGKLGPVGAAISGVLDKLGVKNLDAAAGFGIATAAVGAAVAIGEKAIDMYVKLADRIRTYANVTGESAEQASRQVQAFDALGVNSETAAAGMFKLAKAANTNAEGLAQLGIEVARNNDGTVDLDATLMRTINAYQATGDAARRDAIILATFGKAGAAMIPVLETNIAQLKRLQAQVEMVYTQKDLDAIKQYTIAEKEAQHSADEWGLTLGQTLLPAKKAFFDSMNENVYVARHLDEEMVKLTGSTTGNRQAMAMADRELREQWKAAQDASVEIDQLAASQRRAADAAKAEEEAEAALAEAIHKDIDASFAYQQSLIDLNGAIKDVKDAKGKDAQANLRLREAYVKVSEAAVDLAVQQATLSGKTLSTADTVQIQIDKLHQLERGINPKSQLYKDIEGYIALLKRIPGSVHTTINASGRGVSGSTTHRGGGGVQMSEGGIVRATPGGTLATLGEGPHDEAVIPLNGSGGGMGGGTHFHFHDAVYADGPGLDRLARKLIERGRHTPGT